MHQQRAGPQRLQEPADLQRQDQGLPQTAAEEESRAGHDDQVRNLGLVRAGIVVGKKVKSPGKTAPL